MIDTHELKKRDLLLSRIPNLSRLLLEYEDVANPAC